MKQITTVMGDRLTIQQVNEKQQKAIRAIRAEASKRGEVMSMTISRMTGETVWVSVLIGIATNFQRMQSFRVGARGGVQKKFDSWYQER